MATGHKRQPARSSSTTGPELMRRPCAPALSGTSAQPTHCTITARGNHMRRSTAVGIAIYVALVGGVIGGAYAAVEAIGGAAPGQTASLGVVKQGPGVPNSRKWTPVEIKREVAELPPPPAYVVPSNAARA